MPPVVLLTGAGASDDIEGLVEGLQVRGRRSEDLRSELSDPEQLCSRVEFA